MDRFQHCRLLRADALKDMGERRKMRETACQIVLPEIRRPRRHQARLRQAIKIALSHGAVEIGNQHRSMCCLISHGCFTVPL